MPASESVAPVRGVARALRSRKTLLLAFTLAVMAAPVSSVAYAIEAALRALDGDLSLLVPTMSLVVVLFIALIAAVLYGTWVRAGRPRGIRNVAAEAVEVPG